MKSVDTEALSP